jgi:hypothetical protein
MQIFDRQIAQFAGLFSEDSSAIFKDEKEKLIHPGEYGKYREESCKSLLRTVLDRSVNISDGFIITSDDRITTQCDIIVYNSNVSPLIADGIARMFLAEEVRMIGEVKSSLDRQGFIGALRKIAENKRTILEGRCGLFSIPAGRTSETFNTIISFLVCNKLSFNYDKLTNEEIYEGIDRKYWHNAILSVEDVAMNYVFEYTNYSQEIKEKLVKDNFNMDYVAAWGYPRSIFQTEIINHRSNHKYVQADNKYAHIRSFFVDLSSCCNDVWIYTHDPIIYLGMNAKNFSIE